MNKINMTCDKCSEGNNQGTVPKEGSSGQWVMCKFGSGAERGSGETNKEAPPVAWAADDDSLDYCGGNGEGSGHIRDTFKKYK